MALRADLPKPEAPKCVVAKRATSQAELRQVSSSEVVPVTEMGHTTDAPKCVMAKRVTSQAGSRQVASTNVVVEETSQKTDTPKCVMAKRQRETLEVLSSPSHGPQASHARCMCGALGQFSVVDLSAQARTLIALLWPSALTLCHACLQVPLSHADSLLQFALPAAYMTVEGAQKCAIIAQTEQPPAEGKAKKKKKKKKPKAEDPDPEPEGPTWDCSACTFRNPESRHSCEMCEGPRVVHTWRDVVSKPSVIPKHPNRKGVEMADPSKGGNGVIVGVENCHALPRSKAKPAQKPSNPHKSASNERTISSASGASWTCSGCTFVNKGTRFACEMCDTPKAVEVWKDVPRRGAKGPRNTTRS